MFVFIEKFPPTLLIPQVLTPVSQYYLRHIYFIFLDRLLQQKKNCPQHIITVGRYIIPHCWGRWLFVLLKTYTNFSGTIFVIIFHKRRNTDVSGLW